MACIHPVIVQNKYITKLFKLGKLKYNSIEVPCGKCLNCRIAKQSSLIFLSQKELLTQYNRGKGASFVTITYDDNHIPVNRLGKMTLKKRDLKLFMKRLRRRMEYYNDKTEFKYIYSGEYGDCNSRPHYHIAFLGLSTEQLRKYTRKVWKNGLCDIGVLNNGGLRYVCKYMTKQNPSKKVREVYEKNECEPPFLYHSIGLGKDWVSNHIDEIAQNNFTFNINGKINVLPKWICQFVSLRTGIDYRPIVQKFMNKKLFNEAHNHSAYIEDWQRYDAQVKYMNFVQTARAKGIAVDDEIGSKIPRLRSYHFHDRKVEKLAEIALYGDVVPF